LGCLELLDSGGAVRRRWKFRSGQYRIGFDGDCQVNLNPDQPQQAAVRAAFGPGRTDLVAEFEPMLVLGQPWRQLRIALATELMFCGYKLRFTPLPLSHPNASPVPAVSDRPGGNAEDSSPAPEASAGLWATSPLGTNESTAEQLRSSLVVDPAHVIRLINAHHSKIEALEKAIDRLTEDVRLIIVDPPPSVAPERQLDMPKSATEHSPAEPAAPFGWETERLTSGESTAESFGTDESETERLAAQRLASLETQAAGPEALGEPAADPIKSREAPASESDLDTIASAELERLRNLLTGGGDDSESWSMGNRQKLDPISHDFEAEVGSGGQAVSRPESRLGAGDDDESFGAEVSSPDAAPLFDTSSPLAALFRGELPHSTQERTPFEHETPEHDTLGEEATLFDGEQSDSSERAEAELATAPEPVRATDIEDRRDADDDMSVEDYMQQLLSRLRPGQTAQGITSNTSSNKSSKSSSRGSSSGVPNRSPPGAPAAASNSGGEPTIEPPAMASATESSSATNGEPATSGTASRPTVSEQSPAQPSVSSPMTDLAGSVSEPVDSPNRSAFPLEPARGWNGHALSEELTRLRELELDMRSIRSVANNTVDLVLLSAERSRLVRNLSVQSLIALVGILSAVGCSMMSELAAHLQVLGTGVGSVLATYAAVKAVGSYRELLTLNRRRALDGSGEIAADKM
jgi:hypothetical protein